MINNNGELLCTGHYSKCFYSPFYKGKSWARGDEVLAQDHKSK